MRCWWAASTSCRRRCTTRICAWAACRDRVARHALLAGLGVLVVRASLTRMPRYSLVGYAALAVAGGRGLAWLAARPGSRWPFRLVVAAVGLLVADGVLQAGLVIDLGFQPQHVLAGHIDRDEYLRRHLPGQRATEWLNQHVEPAAGRVLLVGETCRAYLELPHIMADEYHRNPLHQALLDSHDPAEVSAVLRRAGVTYVLRNRAEELRIATKGAAETPPSLVSEVDRYLASAARRVYGDENAEVWQLR